MFLKALFTILSRRHKNKEAQKYVNSICDLNRKLKLHISVYFLCSNVYKQMLKGRVEITLPNSAALLF